MHGPCRPLPSRLDTAGRPTLPARDRESPYFPRAPSQTLPPVGRSSECTAWRRRSWLGRLPLSGSRGTFAQTVQPASLPQSAGYPVALRAPHFAVGNGRLGTRQLSASSRPARPGRERARQEAKEGSHAALWRRWLFLLWNRASSRTASAAARPVTPPCSNSPARGSPVLLISPRCFLPAISQRRARQHGHVGIGRQRGSGELARLMPCPFIKPEIAPRKDLLGIETPRRSRLGSSRSDPPEQRVAVKSGEKLSPRLFDISPPAHYRSLFAGGEARRPAGVTPSRPCLPVLAALAARTCSGNLEGCVRRLPRTPAGTKPRCQAKPRRLQPCVV